MKNYTEFESKYIDEIHSKVTIYKHNKTGARICTISNDDPNKVFMIAFRTPAINSTGLTHILEHSVLCGSKKFPVKDPFLELMKGSLNTFLNAFTGPDRTMYPCASQNSQDFKNLMNVYADAVFYPNIYAHEEIFRQEGWRYELFDKKDPITYNGVVYNEMKGAFSSPDDILGRTVLNSLFPETPYQFESGGDPAVIPQLSYQEFINFHKKYYSPSNSFIYLYGDCDMEERMTWLDENYLSKFEKVEFNTEVKPQKPFDKIRELTISYPISESEKEEHKSKIAYAFAFDNISDEEQMATGIIDDILINDPGAPLKKALLDAKVGSSVELSSDASLVTSMDCLIVSETDKDQKDKILSVYHQTIEDILKKGLDKKSIESHINNLDFKLREGKFAYYPRGLGYIMASLDTWTYDDKDAMRNFNNLAILQQLKEDAGKGFFEKVLEKYYLNNKFGVVVTMIPSKDIQKERDAALAKKLADFKASLTEDQIAEMVKDSEHLRAYQQEPSSPEELATLPKLTQEDLENTPIIDYKSEILKNQFETYKQAEPTNGIVYGGLFFHVEDLPNEMIPYVKLMTDLFGKLDTKEHKSVEMTSEVLSNFGDFSVSYIDERYPNNNDKLHGEVRARFSYLSQNSNKAFALIKEVIFDTQFEDTKHLYESLCAKKNGMISMMNYSGHIVAVNRAWSHANIGGYFADQTNGIAYLDFVSDLIKNFEAKKDEIIKKLNQARAVVFGSDRFYAYYTGEDKNYAVYAEETQSFYKVLKPSMKFEGKLTFVPDFKNEAIRAPFDVDYVARAGVMDPIKKDYGSLVTLLNIISTEYLWMLIRVKGGAYGAMTDLRHNGIFFLTSYRDPNLKETNDVYGNLPEFVKNMKYTPEEMLKFKIGALGGLVPVLHVSDQGFAGFTRKHIGITQADQLKNKESLIHAENDKLKAFSANIAETLKKMPLVVFGNSKKIDENKEMFDVIRDFVTE